MRGRLYDSSIGRFLSPDPFVQSPFHSQSHNRYSYVWNNPLRYTDPTGYLTDQIVCGSVPEDGCAEYIGVNGPAPEPLQPPDLSWIDDTWYATGPDGRRRERGNGGGGGDTDRVTAGELMEMSPEERRAFMQQAAPGLPMPANFEAIELNDQLSDFTAQEFAKYLRTLEMAVGVNVAAVPPMIKAPTLLAAKGPVAGGGAAIENIPASEAARIQNAANRIGKPIHVVGSRASGKAGPNSDWDFIIEANHHTRSSAASSLPGAKSVQEGFPRNQDIFKGPLDPSKPHVTFFPE